MVFAVLLSELRNPHVAVDGAAPTLKYEAEGHAEVPVEASVNDGVQKTVSVPKPQKDHVQPAGNHFAEVAQKGFD